MFDEINTPKPWAAVNVQPDKIANSSPPIAGNQWRLTSQIWRTRHTARNKNRKWNCKELIIACTDQDKKCRIVYFSLDLKGAVVDSWLYSSASRRLERKTYLCNVCAKKGWPDNVPSISSTNKTLTEGKFAGGDNRSEPAPVVPFTFTRDDQQHLASAAAATLWPLGENPGAGPCFLLLWFCYWCGPRRLLLPS